MAVIKPPNRNLPPDATPWARWVEDNITSQDTVQAKQAQGLTNALKGVNGTIQGLTALPVTRAVGDYGVSIAQLETINTPEIAVPSWAASAAVSLSIDTKASESGSTWAYWTYFMTIQYFDTNVGSWQSLGGTQVFLVAPAFQAQGTYPIMFPNALSVLPGPTMGNITRVRGLIQNLGSSTGGGSGNAGSVSYLLTAIFSR